MKHQGKFEISDEKAKERAATKFKIRETDVVPGDYVTIQSIQHIADERIQSALSKMGQELLKEGGDASKEVANAIINTLGWPSVGR